MNLVGEMELYDILDEVIFKVDSSLQILSANSGSSDIGYDINTLKGKVFDVMVSPQYRRVFRALVDTAFKLWNITKAKISVLNAYGDHIPVELKVVPIENKGSVEFYIVLKPEYVWNFEIFKEFIYPVIVVDSFGKIIFSNLKALRILEKVPTERIIKSEVVEVSKSAYKVSAFTTFHKLKKIKIMFLTEVPQIDPNLEKFAIAGIMSSLVSHDLKNSLTSLQFLVEAVTDKNLKEKLNRVSKRITKIHQRVLNIIKPSLRFSEFTLKSLVEEILEDLSHKASSKRLEIKVALSENFKVYTDRDVLYEILHNLLSNAIDASYPGGRVIVSAGSSQSDGDIYKYISVRDFGKGIDEKTLSKIFEPFFTTKEGGTGLGLFIVKKFVNILNGKVVVKSEKGKGSEFVVYIKN